jgi:hypothetical protein
MSLSKKSKLASRPKGLTVAKLKKRADAVFSAWVRQRDEKLGCITCKVVRPWKETQTGHFVSRKVSMLRYDPINCNAQCPGCNVFKHGDLFTYAIELDKKYGKGTAEKLHAQRFSTHKFTVTELEDIIKQYS